jgi:hypothetical protein
LDEVEKANVRRADIRNLLKFFVEMERNRQDGAARATLVVTCRHINDLDDLNAGGWDSPSLTEAVINVSVFNNLELQNAIKSSALPEFVGQRILDHAVRRDGLNTRSTFPDRTRPVDEVVFESIRHPIIWNCFREVLSPELQHAALDGERQGLDEIARRLVDWFCNKAHRRVQTCTCDDIHGILRRVAQKCNHELPNQKKVLHWIQPACQFVGEVMAARLWLEAVSAGVIRKLSPTEWRWQHRFVYEFLRDSDPYLD